MVVLYLHRIGLNYMDKVYWGWVNFLQLQNTPTILADETKKDNNYSTKRKSRSDMSLIENKNFFSSVSFFRYYRSIRYYCCYG